MSSLRTRVLSCFKTLHRARQQVFVGDVAALSAGRHKINNEFAKNKEVVDEKAIKELVVIGEEAARFMKASVLQMQLNEKKGAYELRITKDTVLPDNVPYTGGDDDFRSYKDIKGPCKTS